MIHFSFLLLLSLILPPVIDISADAGSVHNLDSGLNYSTIQEAVDAAETLDGHTIFVESGVYHENVVLRKSVHLLGQNKTNTVIVSAKSGNTVTVRASNCVVSGFTISNGDSGISLENVRNCTITYNILTNNMYGILLRLAEDNIIRQNVMKSNLYNFHVVGRFLSHFMNNVDSSNTVDGKPVYYLVNEHNKVVPPDVGYVAVVNSTRIIVRSLHLINNGNGVLFAFVKDSVIENVSVNNNYDGIWMGDCENCTIAENDAGFNGHYGMELERLVDCRVVGNVAERNGDYGIRVVDSRNVSLVGNEACWNRYGIVVQFSRDCLIGWNNVSNNHGMGIWPKFCENCRIIGNKACNNGFYGVEPEDSSNCIISENIFLQNGLYGVWLLGALTNCNNHTVKNNYFERNKVGIALENSSFNQIYHNNFIRNEHQAITQNSRGNKWSFNSEGNYWSNYLGFDMNGDGVGDTPYVVDEKNRDDHPLMGMFSLFKPEERHVISVTSNSTIKDLKVFAFNGTIKVQIFNMSVGQGGFLRISFPKEYVTPQHLVILIEGKLADIVFFNESVYDNGTHRWIYIAYLYSVNKIEDFTIILIGVLLVMATVTTVFVFRRRFRRKFQFV